MKFRQRWFYVFTLIVISACNHAFTDTVFISDDFNRADSSLSLGTTLQGYAWGRRNLSSGTGENAPGIADNTMKWVAQGSNGVDAAYLGAGTDCQNFKLDVDYIKTYASAHSFLLNFRMYAPSNMVTDGGITPGYCISIARTSDTNLQIGLYDDYSLTSGLIGNAAITDDSSHITLCAYGNNIKVYVNDANCIGEALIDYTDVSSNPASDDAGYFTLYNNIWSTAAIDNFVVTVPDPTTLSLIAIGTLCVMKFKKK